MTLVKPLNDIPNTYKVILTVRDTDSDEKHVGVCFAPKDGIKTRNVADVFAKLGNRVAKVVKVRLRVPEVLREERAKEVEKAE